jgi:anti-sigma regulatory factor (Ser/Thr protein kinase)
MFQAASLPASLPSSPQLTFSGFYEPGRAEALIGGDWYDALRLPDGRIVISIGDVAGSGLQAAIVMGSVRQVIRGVAHIYTDPLPILEAADKALQSEQPDQMVTSFVGIIDPIERTLCYALAGHPPPILRHPDGRVEELPGRGLPLGLRSHEEHSYTITLEEGALLILYTDGLVESTHDLCSGLNRLRAAIAEVSVPSDSTLARTIASRVLGAHPSDDVAVMTVEVHFCADAYRSTHRWRFDARDPLQSRAALDRYLNYLREQAWKGDYHGAALIFLELIGNVVRHAPGQAEVVIDGSGPTPVLHVLDHGFGFKRSRWDVPADIMSENGRGLFLISAYTEDFQVTYREGGGSHARAILSMRH